MPNRPMPLHAVLFREHWRAYRLSKDQGTQPKRWHLSTTTLWRLRGTDMWNTYLDAVAGITCPATYVALRTVTRLRDARRQRWLEENGYLDLYSPSRALPQLDDEQLDRFIDLAQTRLNRLLKPPFVPRFIHKLLWELGLFVYRGPDDSLSAEEVTLLALACTLSGQIGGDRRGIRREYGVAKVTCRGFAGFLQEMGIGAYKSQRVRHPMVRRTPRETLQRIWRYFQGGRVLLWLSSVVYWRYWRAFRKGNTRLGMIVSRPVAVDAPLSQTAS